MSCEPQIIRYLIQLMKYGTWEALPANISDLDRLKLNQEVDFYLINLKKAELPQLKTPIKHQGVPRDATKI